MVEPDHPGDGGAGTALLSEPSVGLKAALQRCPGMVEPGLLPSERLVGVQAVL